MVTDCGTGGSPRLRGPTAAPGKAQAGGFHYGLDAQRPRLAASVPATSADARIGVDGARRVGLMGGHPQADLPRVHVGERISSFASSISERTL